MKFPPNIFVGSVYLESPNGDEVSYTIKNVHTNIDNFKKDLESILEFAHDEGMHPTGNGIFTPMRIRKLLPFVKQENTESIEIGTLQKLDEFIKAHLYYKLYDVIVARSKDDGSHIALLPVLRNTPEKDVTTIVSFTSELVDPKSKYVALYELDAPMSFEFASTKMFSLPEAKIKH